MIRKNPRLRGMGTLKTPVPVALLQEIIKEEVERFNAREGRRGMGMNGRSFNQVFAESYMKQHVVGISDFTRSLYLLEREVVMIQFADQESPVHAVEALAELLDKRPISPCFYDFSMLMPPKHYTESQKQDSEKPENPAYLI